MQTLLERTGGIPLYLHYLMPELVAAADAERDLRAVISGTPKGFSAYVKDQVRRLFSEGGGLRSEVRSIFALLAVALDAVSETDLEAITEFTALDLPALPLKVTRWFQIRSHSDGSITCAFAHPELAREFARALGKLARDKERDLIDYCRKWTTHGSPYALQFLPDHLLRAGQATELFALAHQDAFFAAQRRAFPNDAQKPLKSVRIALSAAADVNDAAAMAGLALLQARRISGLLTESPVDALLTGPLSRVWELADLHEPDGAILWHMFVAAELLSKENREAAVRTLLRLQQRSLAPLSGWYGVAAAGLLLPLSSLDAKAVVQLSRQLLPGYGQSIEVVVAIHPLAERLAERGQYDLALKVGEVRRDWVLVAVVRHRARQGDFTGALGEIKKISNDKARAEATAAVASEFERVGDSERARKLLISAAKGARRTGRGYAEVAVQFARSGYSGEALELLEEVRERELWWARALKDVAIAAHENGDDPNPPLLRLERFARQEAGSDRRPVMLAELVVANLKTSRASAALQIRDELTAVPSSDKNWVRGLVTIAAAFAETHSADAERLFELALKHARNLTSDADQVTADIARDQADAGLFTRAAETLSQMTAGSWRAFAWNTVAVRRAGRGELNEALAMLDFRNRTHKEALAEIASDLLARGDWQNARRVFIELLSSTEEPSPVHRPKRDVALARIAAVLARQKLPDQARSTLASITDGDSKADALRDLAVAYAEGGDIAFAVRTAREISEDHPYVREVALGRVALAAARQGDAAIASNPDILEGLHWLPWHAARDLLILLRQQNALGLIEEFRPFQGKFQSGWWESDIHINAIRCVALARSGDVAGALALAGKLSGNQVLATFERIAPIVRQLGRLEELAGVALGLHSAGDAARALTGIAIAQNRLKLVSEADQSLKMALGMISQIEETHDRQHVLVGIGVAHQIAGSSSKAEEMWIAADQLRAWHYSRDRDTGLAPWDADDIAEDIVQGLAAAGLGEEALRRVSTIDDLYKRGTVLERISHAFAPGESSPEK